LARGGEAVTIRGYGFGVSQGSSVVQIGTLFATDIVSAWR
jgi:hypothetical protein